MSETPALINKDFWIFKQKIERLPNFFQFSVWCRFCVVFIKNRASLSLDRAAALLPNSFHKLPVEPLPAVTNHRVSEEDIFFALSTYNRLPLLEHVAKSMEQIEGIDRLSLFVFDDCSSEYDLTQLKHLFPRAKQHVRRNHNLRADQHMYQIFVDFLHSGYKVLFLADADLLYRADFLENFARFWPQTQGVLSFYNSKIHQPVKKHFIEEQGVLLTKQTIGAAGTFLSRQWVAKVVALYRAKEVHYFDWFWVHCLTCWGAPLYVCQNSVVQHIGIGGQNTQYKKNYQLEIGLGFEPTNEADAVYLTNFYHQLCHRMALKIGWRQLGEMLFCNLLHWLRFMQIWCITRVKFWWYSRNSGSSTQQ